MELIRTLDHGQVSVYISKQGITKGQHWHLSKWEIFIVVHGYGLIQMRDLKSGEIEEYEVIGEKPGSWKYRPMRSYCTEFECILSALMSIPERMIILVLI